MKFVPTLILLFLSFVSIAQEKIDYKVLQNEIKGLNNEKKWEHVVLKAESYRISSPSTGLELLAWVEKQPFFENRYTSGYLLRKADLLKNNGNQDKALSTFDEALKRAANDKDTLNMAGVLSKLSDTYSELGNTEKMMAAARQSLAYYSVIKDTASVINCYLKMSYADRETNPEKTVKQLKSLLPMASRDSMLISNVYSNIGSIFETMKKPDSSYHYNRLFLQYNPKEYLPNKFVALYNLGQNLRDLKRYPEFLKTNLQAYEVSKLLNFHIYDTYIRIALAESEQLLGNMKGAENYLANLDKGLLNAEQTKQFSQIKYIVAKDKKDFKAAMTYLELFKSVSDSLNNVEKTKALGEVKAKYDIDLKEEQVKVLEENNFLKKQQISNQKIGLGVLSALLLALGYLLYRNIQQKKQIASNNEVITASLKEKDILLREIHHRVKNNLQVVSSLLNLQSNYITDDIALEAINEGKNRVLSMALIHQNLYSDKHLTAIETKGYFDDLLDQLFDSYNIDEEHIKLEKDIDTFLIDVDTMIPLGLITNELISNALKHAFKNRENGLVYFSIKKINDNIVLTIKDDGIGVEPLQFESSRSFGNKMIQAFIQKLKANLKVRNEQGTEIVLLCPMMSEKVQRA